MTIRAEREKKSKACCKLQILLMIFLFLLHLHTKTIQNAHKKYFPLRKMFTIIFDFGKNVYNNFSPVPNIVNMFTIYCNKKKHWWGVKEIPH